MPFDNDMHEGADGLARLHGSESLGASGDDQGCGERRRRPNAHDAARRDRAAQIEPLRQRHTGQGGQFASVGDEGLTADRAFLCRSAGSAPRRTALAWVREWPEAPSAANLKAVLERLAHIRRIGLEPDRGRRIHRARYGVIAREAAIMSA